MVVTLPVTSLLSDWARLRGMYTSEALCELALLRMPTTVASVSLPPSETVLPTLRLLSLAYEDEITAALVSLFLSSRPVETVKSVVGPTPVAVGSMPRMVVSLRSKLPPPKLGRPLCPEPGPLLCDEESPDEDDPESPEDVCPCWKLPENFVCVSARVAVAAVTPEVDFTFDRVVWASAELPRATLTRVVLRSVDPDELVCPAPEPNWNGPPLCPAAEAVFVTVMSVPTP
jgi:hypothetical protein